jgi:phosphoribosylglycinamide formyltransferase-1
VKKFAFYVSGSAGRLKKLFDISHEILGSTFLIFTDSSRALYIQANCLVRNIDFVYFDYEKAKTDSKKPNIELSETLLVQLKKHSIDYCFSFGDNLLKGELLKYYEKRLINFHPSLLPSFPGRLAINKAIDAEVTLLGHTAHYIDEGIDTGGILAQLVVSRNEFLEYGMTSFLDLQLILLDVLFYRLMEKPSRKGLPQDFITEYSFIIGKND